MKPEVRLWTGKNKPWDNPNSMDIYKSSRDCLEAWIDLSWRGMGISFQLETQKQDGSYEKPVSWWDVGFQFCFKFGYEVHQYDGFWHRFSIGPFFVTWCN